jgi:hypothetical protein
LECMIGARAVTKRKTTHENDRGCTPYGGEPTFQREKASECLAVEKGNFS